MDNCSRCAGLMVMESFPQMWDTPILHMRRCVCCGHVTDPVVEANRGRGARASDAGLAGVSKYHQGRRLAAQALSVS